MSRRTEKNQTAIDALKRRLREGVRQLAERHGLLVALPWDNPKYRRLEAAFTRGLDRWIYMEEHLRLLGYNGCIFSPEGRCKRESVVSCEACPGEPGWLDVPGPKQISFEEKEGQNRWRREKVKPQPLMSLSGVGTAAPRAR